MRETQVQSLGQEDLLEKEMAAHCSILAWKIPQTEEPGGAAVHGIAKSRTRLSNFTFIFYYCVTVNFSFMSINIFFSYLGAPFLSAHEFTIVSSWTDSLIIMYSASLLSCNSIYLKYILFYVSIATLVFCWFLFACNTFFYSLTCSLCISLDLKGVSCRQHVL